KMSLPKFNLALPQRSADRGGQTAIIPCRDRKHGRGAIANDGRFRPNRAAASREADEMRAKTDGVKTVETTEEILAKVPQDGEFVFPVARGFQGAGAVLPGAKGLEGLCIKLPDVPPAHRRRAVGFPLRTVGAGKGEERPQTLIIPAESCKLRHQLSIIPAGFGVFLESAPVGNEKLRYLDRLRRELAFRHIGCEVFGQRDTGKARCVAFV